MINAKIIGLFILILFLNPTLFYVDKINMGEIYNRTSSLSALENQNISKRRRAKQSLAFDFKSGYTAAKNKVSAKTKHNIKSAGFSSVFMQSAAKKTFKKADCRKPGEKRAGKKHERAKSGFGSATGFTFNLPVLPILASAAGIFVIALAAFNWEDIKLPEMITFTPVLETEAEHHTLQYATTGITSFFPAAIERGQSRDRVGTEQGQSGDRAVSEQGQSSDRVQMQNDLITFEWQEYRVKRGDSVSAIAQNFGISMGAIIASNDIRNARTLREGAVLRLPNIDGIPYQVKSGDTLSKIAASFNVPLEVILDVNDIKSDAIRQGETLFIPGARMNDIDLRMSLGELFIYPVPSRYITSSFGMRKDPISGVLAFHTGIDLRADTGTTVAAALDGVVSFVGENWLYGKYIILTHDNGYKTLYAHLNAFSVRQGERVARGRKIGESGNTGYSTGPHLHFSVYDRNNKLVNPLELLR